MRIERIDTLEQHILEHKSVSIDRLCEVFQVSKNTIRRDINVLCERGVIRKVYGGVTVNESAPVSNLIPYEERTISHCEEKNQISECAASFVEDHDTIFIDSGTTTLNMVDFLSERKNITILTYNLQIILKLLPYDHIDVIVLPGTLKRSTSSFVGIGSAEFIQSFNINKAFMACTGLSISNGVTNAAREEYEIKKAAMAKSQMHVLLADSSKYNTISLMTYADIADFDTIISNHSPSAEYMDYFKKKEIKFIPSGSFLK